MKISKGDFDRQYDIITNKASGNCLFEAISYSINELTSNDELSHQEVRMQISEFYSKFDMDIKYPERSIECAIILGLKYDNDDVDDSGQCIPHDINVRNDKVWGSMTDLLVCSVLYDVDINLYKQNHDLFEVECISYQYKNKNTISILYNGVNHFESIVETIFHD